MFSKLFKFSFTTQEKLKYRLNHPQHVAVAKGVYVLGTTSGQGQVDQKPMPTEQVIQFLSASYSP